jgi:hypothetical protein
MPSPLVGRRQAPLVAAPRSSPPWPQCDRPSRYAADARLSIDKLEVGRRRFEDRLRQSEHSRLELQCRLMDGISGCYRAPACDGSDPKGIIAVSPPTTSIFSNGTPSASAAICA